MNLCEIINALLWGLGRGGVKCDLRTVKRARQEVCRMAGRRRMNNAQALAWAMAEWKKHFELPE